MARVRIVEVIDGRGQIRARVKVDAFPVSIGRAFDNDVILDDPYVSPHHLRLDEDEEGRLWAVDLGSVNGTRRDGQRVGDTRFAVSSGATITAGRTPLRVYDVDHAVPEAIRENAHAHPFAQTFLDRRAAAYAVMACGGYFAVRGYLGSTSRDAIEDMVPMAVGVLALTAAWAGLWALIGRMTHTGARYLAHFGWACVGAIALTLIASLLGWGEFALPSNVALGAASGVLLAVAFAIYLAGHVTLASSLSLRQAVRRLTIGFGAIAVIGALLTLTARDRFSFTPEYPTAILPLPPAVLVTEDVDAFAAQALKLQRDVDELAKKREREPLLSNPLKGL